MVEETTRAQNSHSHPENLGKKQAYLWFGILFLLIVLSAALLYSQNNQAPALDLSAKVSLLEQRVAAIEQKLVPPTVKMRLLYDSKDAFTEGAIAEVAAAQASLAQQGLSIEIQDVSGRLEELRKQGYSSLPALFLSDAEAAKNQQLLQAMQVQPRVDGGYRIPAFGFITTAKTMLGLECRPGNSSARLYEFANYDCGQCAALDPPLKSLLEQFGNKTEYAFKHYPVPGMQLAQNASEAVVCAGLQGLGRKLHEQLFLFYEKPGEWRIDETNSTRNSTSAMQKIIATAGSLSINSTELEACLAGPYPSAKVDESVAEGVTSYDLQRRASLLPAFVVDCKHVFLAETAGEVREGVCAARPELC